jgi:YidC/Oxa1 family membrane protein insertase
MKTQERDLNSTKGTFIAIALCVALYLGWNQYLTTKYPSFGQAKKTVPTETTASKPEQSAVSTSTPTAETTPQLATPATPAVTAPTAMASSDLSFDTKNVTFTFSQELGSLTSAKLKDYRLTNEKSDQTFVELFARPGAIQGYAGQAPERTGVLPFSGKKTSDGIKFSRTEGTWNIDQQWTLPTEGYAGKLTVTYTNTATEAKPLVATLLTEVGEPTENTKSSFFAPGQPAEKPRFLTQTDGSDEFTNLEDFCKDQSMTVSFKDRKLDFFGFDTHYFAFAMVPQAKANYRTAFSGRGSQTHPLCEIITAATSDFGMVAPAASVALTYDVWFGPKDVELLTAFNPHLKTTLGLGWLDMIAHPLLLSIKGLYKFTGNYGIAIILLTILLKILFFPLTKQAAHSAARMKKLNPEMNKLKERYKNDQQRMQMELMKFMSTHKINPMKGCLPILPTIPVFFALFRVLSASIDLRHAPFYAWITDLSVKDPYLITPFILTGFMFIQHKLTPMTGMDPTQEKVMMFMPIIFGVMMITLPSGLVLYMLTNTLMSIGQQQYLNRKFANI